MRKNASKILGIFLAVLMIVGNMTTFATATLAAGETSVTFLDEGGNVITTIQFDGSTTVNTLLAADSVEAKLVKKAIAQTDTKVFLGWTLDGAAFDVTTEITESKTVKASFSKYKLYTHADIESFYESGNIVLAKSTHDTTVTNAFRMKSNATGSHALNWAIAFDNPADAGNSPTIDSTKLIDNAAATREYEVFVAKYKTNQSATSTGNTSWIQIYNKDGVNVGADGYSGPTNNDKKRIQYSFSPTGVTEDGTGIDDITAVYQLSRIVTDTKISGFRFAPWSGASITKDTSLGPATDTDYKVAYADIEYFALFEKEEAVALFDYSKYGNFDVTFVDENNNEITSISAKSGITLGAILEANPADKALINAATPQKKNKVFAGWTLENGTAVDANTTFSAKTTLKPSYSAYKVYTAEDLRAENSAGRFSPKNTSVSYASIVTGGDKCFILKGKDSMKGRAVWLYWTFDTNVVLAAANVEAIATKFKTNTHDLTPPTSAAIRLVDSTLAFDNANYLLTYDFPTEAGADGFYEVNAVFEIPDSYTAQTINGLAIAPWNGQYLPTVDTEAGESYADYYAAYEYVAIFEKKDGAQYFDYETYLELPAVAIFEDTAGATVNTLEADGDGKVVLPPFNGALGEDEAFVGWMIKGDSASTVYAVGEKVAITGITTFVPTIAESITVSVNDNGEEDKQIKAFIGLNLPLDELELQYIDAESGELMVISGLKVGDTEYPIDDGYIVSGTEASIEVLYDTAYIASEANSTLDGGLRSGSEGMNDPVKLEEDGVFYQHFTTINGANTVAESQLSFEIGVGPVLYSANPYVSYGYRTNIERDTWNAAYSINGFSAVTKEDGTKHYGTGKFSQPVAGFVSDDKWNIATHKATSFGTFPDEEKFADEIWNLDQLYLAPWQAEEGITLTGEEYVDIQYIGFFPNETAAKLFDHELYIDSFKVNVTVEIDGVKNEALSGEYFEGTVIELPKNTGVAGYLYDGVVVTSVKVPDGNANVTISATSRTVNSTNYITYDRGDLNNLKKAYKDKGAITVVYIGGSVTAGHGASSKANIWTSLTTEYLRTKFDNVTEYNEAMGGHGSRSAAYRAAGDVLAHKPDIVFIETSQNDIYDGDADNGYDGKYYEYLIRTIRDKFPSTEIVTVYIGSYGAITDEDENGNLVLIEGKHVAAAGQDQIAAAYDIPSIDATKYTFEAIFGKDKDGNVNPYNGDTWAKYYKDYKDVHPIDAGYALYARAIEDYLEAALADVDDLPDEVPAETRPDAPLNDGVSDFTPEIIPLDSPAVSVDGFELIPSRKSSTFTNYLKLKNNPGSGTVKFSFVGTELGIFMKMPDEDDTGYEGGDPDADQSTEIAGVTVTIDDTVYTKTPSRKSPMMYDGLKDTRHDVTITFTKIPAASCPIYGLMVDGRLTQYTVELTASEGGTVSYEGGDPGDSFKIYAMKGDKIKLKAHADQGHYLRAWHDLTTGQMIVIPDDNNDGIIEYTVTGDALINANFVPNEIKPKVRLVAFTGRGTEGYFTVNGEGKYPYFDEYVSLEENVTLTAVGANNYTPVGWIRFTQDSNTEVLIGLGAQIDVPALGSSVFYQPVFALEDAQANIFVNKATGEILAKEGTEAPDGYGFDPEEDVVAVNESISVYYCTKNYVADEENSLEVYALGSNDPLTTAQNPAFASSWKISTNSDDTKWQMSINGGSFIDVSYDKVFNFTYNFKDKTTVVIKEVERGEGELTPTIKTVTSWVDETEGATKFTGLFVLPEGCTLLSHGVLMSQTASELSNAEFVDGQINAAEGVIVGHIRDNTENATALFTISKKHNTQGTNEWYGRAFLVYNDVNGTHCMLAETIPTPAV